MKLGSDDIFYMNAFNSVSRVVAKDVVLQGNSLLFLVKKSDVGKAIGKSACNVKTLREQLKKNVEIIGYSESAKDFFQSVFHDVKVKGVEVKEDDGKKTAFVVFEAGEKRNVLANMGRFRRIKEITKRNFDFDEMRIK